MKWGTRFAQASLLIVLLTVTVWAADTGAAPLAPSASPTADSTADPPGRVARLQYMTGQVSVQPQGSEDWVEGSANRPLTNADNIWADKDSRAELNVGTGLMRISSETSLTLTNVDTNAVQVSLHQGALNVHVRHLYDGEVWEIDTPNLAFTVSKPGDYRFDVDPNGDSTMVTVRKGEGQATGQGSPVSVHSGEQARFTGGNSLAHQIQNAPRLDSFDEWCSLRNKSEDNSVSARYVAPGVVGSEDLDEYGSWHNDPQYGAVWTPTSVAPGWAPYSYGHWIWVSPWGWTWVDDAPWGFAPFHYGRWAYIGASWGWIPGPYWYRPWYAPALVGWFGGPGWGFGFGFGFGPRYGWCPLGFRQPFYPWYRVSRPYFHNVNVSNTRIGNINHVSNNFFRGARTGVPASRFSNMNKPGGFTTVSQSTLQRGLPVHSNSIRVTPNDVKGAPALSRVNVNPTREGIVGARSGVGARPSSSAFSRPTVSRMTPPAVSSRPANQVAMSRGGTVSGGRNVGSPISPGFNTARGLQNPAAARSPETQSRTMPATAGRNIPRPPQSLGNTNRGATAGRPLNSISSAQSRTEPTLMAMNHYVPRPPQSSMRSYQSSSSTRSGGLAGSPSASTSLSSRSIPRPPAGSMSARNEGSAYGSSRSMGNSVPRPSGRVQPAPRSYYGPESRGGYSNRAYGGSYGGSYGGRGGYSTRSYGGPYGGSSGSHGGYSAPSHSNGSSGGGYHGSSGGSGSHGGSSGGHSSGSHGGGHR